MTKLKFLLASANSVIQYFNYAVFGLSALALAENLMPGSNGEQKLANFFASIMLTVIARPLGSYLFGYIGDLFGRKPSIIIAGVTSSVASFIASQIPNFNDIGILASIFLILVRMIFLAGLAGEIDGLRLYIAESVSQRRQNLSNGIITLITQSGAFTASYFISYANYDINGWRYCFLIGGVLGILFSLLRIYIPESSEFSHGKNHPSKYYNSTFVQILYGQFKNLLFTIFIFGAIGTLYQFNFIVLPAYIDLTPINFKILSFVPIFISSYAIMAPIWGIIADKYGGFKVFSICSVTILISYFVMFYFISKQNYYYLTYLLIFISSTSSGFSITAHILLKKNLNIGIRYRIFSIGHSLGSLIISTPTGFVVGQIINNYGINYSLIYPISVITIGLIGMNLVSKEFR